MKKQLCRVLGILVLSLFLIQGTALAADATQARHSYKSSGGDVDDPNIVASVTMNAPGKLAVGKSTTLKAKALNYRGKPVKAYCTWTSDNSAVLAVGKTSGVARAKSSGNTIVRLTVKTKHGVYKRNKNIRVVSHAEHIKIRAHKQNYAAYIYPFSKQIIDPETGTVTFATIGQPNMSNTWRALRAIPYDPNIRITMGDKTMDYTCFVYDKNFKNICYTQASSFSQKLQPGEYLVRLNCAYFDKADGMLVNGHGYFKIKV